MEERKFFYEIKRVVKKGGIIRLSTVDFEKTVKQWLKAEDNWIDFHRDDNKAIKEKYWFGTYTYEPKNRWGYLTATFYGSQKGKGQYHKNCYTQKKLNIAIPSTSIFQRQLDTKIHTYTIHAENTKCVDRISVKYIFYNFENSDFNKQLWLAE